MNIIGWKSINFQMILRTATKKKQFIYRVTFILTFFIMLISLLSVFLHFSRNYLHCCSDRVSTSILPSY